MDHRQIETEDQIGRYLRGQLSGSEAECFEDHVLTCAECQDLLDAEQRLVRGLRRLRPELAPGALRPVQVARAERLQWRSVAAGMLMAIGAGVLLWATSAPRAPDGGVAVHAIDSLRAVGAEPDHVLHRSASARWLVLDLALAEPGLAHYRVVVLDAEGQIRFERGGLAAVQGTSLAVILRADLLAAGDYRIEVEGTTATGVRLSAGRYRIRVLPVDPG